MKPRDRSSACRRGAAAVEVALAALFLFAPTMIGLWETARIIEVTQMLVNAAREGGRQASTGQINNAAVQQVVLNYLKYNGLTTTNVVVTVSNLTSPGTDATNATQLDMFQVTVTIPFNDVRFVSLQLLTNATTRLTGQATWCSMKDDPFPTWPTPPAGS